MNIRVSCGIRKCKVGFGVIGRQLPCKLHEEVRIYSSLPWGIKKLIMCPHSPIFVSFSDLKVFPKKIGPFCFSFLNYLHYYDC